MVEATDPINPVNLFFYSFGPFLAQIQKIQKPIKIQLIFRIFPFKGNREGPPKAFRAIPELTLRGHPSENKKSSDEIRWKDPEAPKRTQSRDPQK